jgi:hypothetical protein
MIGVGDCALPRKTDKVVCGNSNGPVEDTDISMDMTTIFYLIRSNASVVS